MSQSYRNNIDDSKNLKQLDKCMDLINKNVKFPLGLGKQGQTFKIVSDECGSVVLKEFFVNKKKPSNDAYKNAYAEQRAMNFFTKIIENNICPNFVKLMHYNKTVPYIVMEYADGDTTFMFKDDHIIKEIPILYDIFICQILIGILCIHSQTLIYHRDLKPANILYKHIDKNIVFHYKINERDYYIPTYGYLFMIGDFGIAGTKEFEYPDVVDMGQEIIKCYSYALSKQFNNYFDFIKGIPPNKQFIIKKEKLDLPRAIDFSIKKNIYNNDTLILKKILDINNMLNYSSSIIEILDKFFPQYAANKSDEKNVVTFTMGY